MSADSEPVLSCDKCELPEVRSHDPAGVLSQRRSEPSCPGYAGQKGSVPRRPATRERLSRPRRLCPLGMGKGALLLVPWRRVGSELLVTHPLKHRDSLVQLSC